MAGDARPERSRSVDDPSVHDISATPSTVSWGSFDGSRDPVRRVEPGDIVRLETVSHHAGDAPDYMMDEGVRAIYDEIGHDERGPGSHIVTGPIHVEGATPGDVLECRILALRPRLPYGSNVCADWGLLHDDFDRQEYVTVYEIDPETDTARAQFQYEFPGSYDKTGEIIDPRSVDRYPVQDGVRVPLRYHLGTAGVAPAAEGPVDTVPPAIYGGNVDNRHFTVGTSMYYPVQVEGGLFTAGDGHLAEGDGEVSGTAIESHLDVTVQFFLRDGIDIGNPVLETDEHWMTHAFDPDLNEAMRKAALEMIDFLEANHGLSRPAAYSLLSTAGDFHTTQVVNGERGIHCKLRKDLFAPASR